MNRARPLIASRFGRRLFGLFTLVALVPIAAMTVVSYGQVNAVLTDVREAELTRAAKSYGMSLIDRLSLVDELLVEIANDARESPLDPRPLAERDGGRFAALAVLTEQGDVLSSQGKVPLDWSVDGRLRSELERGRPVMILAGAPPQPVVIRRFVDRAGQAKLIAAAVDPPSLWGDRDTFPAATDFCIGTAKGLLLHCSRPLAKLPADWFAAERPDGPGPLRFQDGDEVLHGRAWNLFLGAHFAADDWVILAVQPESYALRAVESFRASFLPIAVLALLVALWLAIRQIHRVLVPLERLLVGTQKIARHEFDAQIVVGGDDEFAKLASAFNKMARQLGVHFRTLAALGEIDRTILASLDLREVVDLAARCLRDLVDVDLVSVGLCEPGAPGRFRVYVLQPQASRTAPLLEISCSTPPAATSRLSWTATPDLPAAYKDALSASGARYFAVLPIARGEHVSGLVVLGHASVPPLEPDAQAQIANVLDRLAVALSAAARDKRLHDQAHLDSLTGLPNRYHLMLLLTQALARAAREQRPLAALFVDLDHFKRTNDTLGHAAGDRLLQVAAARIRGAVREADVVARLGGDEFTVVLDGLADHRDAEHIAAKLIDVLSEPFEVDGSSMYAGASVGIALFPRDATSAAELLKCADTAMYQAKARGRGSYAFFQERMNSEAIERTRLDRELRLAIKRDEFVLHFQPQIDTRSGRLESAEALIRWAHPQRGLLLPGAFIEVAEEGGLIDALGAWVLDRACEQLARWRAAGVDVPRVSVNVSSRQLQRADFVERVLQVLAHNRLPPSMLELEVTESLFTNATAVAALRQLKDAGVTIAVDDFGTGYSSFAYLRTLPFSVLKVDRTFIVEVETNAAAATIAAAIVNMAHALGKLVVAEGVETAAQIEYLERVGCERLQGYAISRPLDAAAFEAFARRAALAEPQDAALAA